MDVILELGGNTCRMETAIALAKIYPDAQIIISSEGNPVGVNNMLKAAGISEDKYIFDFNAWDTVTNFTNTLQLVKSYKPENVYVVTDQFHMRRSMAIARATYALQDFELHPVPYLGTTSKGSEDEHLVKTDRFRAWLWRLTGYLKYYPDVKQARMPGIIADHNKCVEMGYPVTELTESF